MIPEDRRTAEARTRARNRSTVEQIVVLAVGASALLTLLIV